MDGNRVCAYCGAEGNLTREHVLPSFIYERERNRSAGPLISNVLDHGKHKSVAAEITTTDVCAACNKGFLSELDEYGSTLYDRYFFEIVQPGRLIRFEFEFALLVRWLLKIAYNACRSYNWPSAFRHHLEGIRPYIRNGGVNPPNLRLYLQLIVPAVLTPLQKLKNWEENGIAADTIDPTIRRIAPFFAIGVNPGYLLGMNSYQFHLVAWDCRLSIKHTQNIEKQFLRKIFGAKRVRENDLWSAIYPSSIDSFKIAEGNRFLKRNAALGAEWVKTRSHKRR